jgi:hypothetical protein
MTGRTAELRDSEMFGGVPPGERDERRRHPGRDFR